MRDEPGIGAFVVALQADPHLGPPLRALREGELARLRATKQVVAERVREILDLRPTMAPPQVHAVRRGEG